MAIKVYKKLDTPEQREFWRGVGEPTDDEWLKDSLASAKEEVDSWSESKKAAYRVGKYADSKEEAKFAMESISKDTRYEEIRLWILDRLDRGAKPFYIPLIKDIREEFKIGLQSAKQYLKELQEEQLVYMYKRKEFSSNQYTISIGGSTYLAENRYNASPKKTEEDAPKEEPPRYRPMLNWKKRD